jgi:hypothetical protein
VAAHTYRDRFQRCVLLRLAGDEAAHSAGESVLLVRRHPHTRTTPSTSSNGPAGDAATNTAPTTPTAAGLPTPTPSPKQLDHDSRLPCLSGVGQKWRPDRIDFAEVGGELALVFQREGRVHSVDTVQITNGLITAYRRVINPDKLVRV